MNDTAVVEKKVGRGENGVSKGPACPLPDPATPLSARDSVPRCIAFIGASSHRSNAGQRCKARPISGLDYCASHDPTRAEQRQSEMAKLHVAKVDRKRITDLGFYPERLNSFDAVLDVLSGLGRCVLHRLITPAEAGAVSNICGQATRTLDLRRQDKLTTALAIHLGKDGKPISATLNVKGDPEEVKRMVESVIENTDSHRQMDGGITGQEVDLKETREVPPLPTGNGSGGATGGTSELAQGEGVGVPDDLVSLQQADRN